MTIGIVTTEDTNGRPGMHETSGEFRYITYIPPTEIHWHRLADVGQPTHSKLPTRIFGTMSLVLNSISSSQSGKQWGVLWLRNPGAVSPTAKSLSKDPLRYLARPDPVSEALQPVPLAGHLRLSIFDKHTKPNRHPNQ